MASMQTVKVSKNYQVIIPKAVRREVGIKPGDRMVAIAKGGVLQYVPVRPISETKGIIQGLSTRKLRDERDRSI